MAFGLTPQQIMDVTMCLRAFPEIERALIFGSRALGNQKATSDIDLYLEGPLVDSRVLNRLAGRLEEDSRTPFTFDLVGANEPLGAELKKHIETFGRLFFVKGSTDPLA